MNYMKIKLSISVAEMRSKYFLLLLCMLPVITVYPLQTNSRQCSIIERLNCEKRNCSFMLFSSSLLISCNHNILILNTQSSNFDWKQCHSLAWRRTSKVAKDFEMKWGKTYQKLISLKYITFIQQMVCD